MNNDNRKKNQVEAPAPDQAESDTNAASGLPAYMMEEAAESPGAKEAPPDEAAAAGNDGKETPPAEADDDSLKGAPDATDAPGNAVAGENPEAEETPATLAQALASEEIAKGAEDSPVMAVAPDGTASPAEASGTFAGPGIAPATPATGAGDGRLDSPSWSYTPKAPPTAAPSAPSSASAEAKKPDSPPKKGLFGKKKAAPKAAAPQRPLVAFAAAHPLLTVEQGMPPSLSSRLYSALALFPLLPLTLMLLAQTVFSLDARALWYPEEVRSAAGLGAMMASGGLAPLVSGTAETATPLYFWFLRALALVVPTQGPMLHLTGAALSGLFFLWTLLCLGRCAARVDGRGNLAAGIVLLGTGVFMGLLHYGSGLLLFAALLTLSHVFLYRALVNQGRNNAGIVIAFLLAAAATLIKGPAGMILPLLSALLFALWRASPRQWLCVAVSGAALVWGLACARYSLPLAQSLGLLSPETESLPTLWLALMLGLPALCLAALALLGKSLRLCAALSVLLLAAAFILAGGAPGMGLPPQIPALPLLALLLLIVWQITPQRLFRADLPIAFAVALLALIGVHVLLIWNSGGLEALTGPFTSLEKLTALAQSLPQSAPPVALLGLPLLFLPWTLLLFCLPWQRLAAKTTREALAASRKPEKEGLAFLWSMVLAAPLTALGAHACMLDVFVVALAPLALLFGRAALGLSGRQASLFKYLMAAFCLLVGLLTIVTALMLFDVLPAPDFLGLPPWTLPAHGGFFLAGGILLVVGALMWVGLSSARPEGVLLLAALAATALGYPLGGMMMPAFDSVRSPKDQSLLLRAYADKGYTVVSLDVPPAVHDFYAGMIVPGIQADALTSLADKGNLLLAVSREKWEQLADQQPGCLKEVHSQWLGLNQYLLLACPPVEGLAPAALPYTKGPDLLEEARKRLDLPLSAPAAAPEEKPDTGKTEKPALEKTPDEAAPEQVQDNAPDGNAPANAPEGGASEDSAQPEGKEPADAPQPDAAPGNSPESEAPKAGAPDGETTEEATDKAPAPGSPQPEGAPGDAAPSDAPDNGTPGNSVQPGESGPAGKAGKEDAPESGTPPMPQPPGEKPDASGADPKAAPDSAPEQPAAPGTAPEQPIPPDTAPEQPFMPDPDDAPAENTASTTR